MNTTDAKVTWRLTGEEVAACNCAWGCPCQFDALPTTGRCEGLGVWQIEKGNFGDIQLDGLRFAMIFSWPGAIHEGNGTMQVIVEDRAKPRQRQALTTLLGGTAGGTMFEIFSSVCPHKLEPLFLPIDLVADRERRVARLRIPNVLDLTVEPIRNPVTGEEHRARIDLPNGFEYKQAEVANAVRWKASCRPPLSIEHQGKHAHLNRFEWSNA